MRSDDIELLDMNPAFGTPADMVLTSMAVPPVCVRPSVQMDGAAGSKEDDLTIRTLEVIRCAVHATQLQRRHD